MNPIDKVVKSTGSVFVEMELSIMAPRRVVWNAFVNKTNDWWHRDFYTSKGPAKFVIDLRLSGNMYEDAGDGAGLIWFTILGIVPDEMLYVIGHTRPPFGGPASGLITFELEAKSETETIFKVSDATFGQVSEDSVTQAESGWRMLFEELKKYVENS